MPTGGGGATVGTGVGATVGTGVGAIVGSGVGGYEQALRTSARAGHSEHQLGTSIDVTSEGGAAPWEYGDWASTPAGGWMAANAWRYGFVMSYPRGAFDRTCYDYEPWHYRYVGRDLAAQIVASGLTPREVIWGRQ